MSALTATLGVLRRQRTAEPRPTEPAPCWTCHGQELRISGTRYTCGRCGGTKLDPVMRQYTPH